ncbi:MAG: SDR family oxidoreductase [Rhizobacter sp.]|nr:SDR family oxidoreductase [Ferruginibacter sp.]
MNNKGGKVAVVTGAAKGIGQAIVRRLAEDGADIAIADIADTSETQALVRKTGRRVVFKHCNTSSEENTKAFAEFVMKEYGRCDILVNNAGIYPFVTFDDMTFDQWRQVMSVNLDGTFLMCKAIVPIMRKQKYGRIANLASAQCFYVASNSLHYIASKMGVIGLTRALATEVADDNITVNALAPGITNTGTVRKDAGEYLTSLPELQAIHRPGDPKDMANIVSFLTSDDVAFMTGQTLVNDGGWARL